MSKLRSGAVLALCGLFAALSMGLTLLAAGVYRAVAAAADENYSHRTALSYLVNQIRRADEAGGVALGSFGDSDALRLAEQVDGTAYVTLIYCRDGQLTELYTEAGSGLGPDDGSPLLPLDGLDLSEENGVLTIRVQAQGRVYTAAMAPRCGTTEAGQL